MKVEDLCGGTNTFSLLFVAHFERHCLWGLFLQFLCNLVVNMLSLKSAHLQCRRKESWTALTQNCLWFYLMFLYLVTVFWLAEVLDLLFCDHCTYSCVGVLKKSDVGKEREKEWKKKTFFLPVSFPSFPLLLLCFYLHFAWSSTTSFFSRIFCGHKKIIQSCVYAMCVHKAAFPIGWNTERKTHTSAAQFEHWYGSLMIPTVDQYHCAHLLRQIESVFNVLCLMRITSVEIWTHTHTSCIYNSPIFPYSHPVSSASFVDILLLSLPKHVYSFK